MVRSEKGTFGRESCPCSYLTTMIFEIAQDGDDVNALDRLEEVSEDEGDDVIRDDEEGEGEDLIGDDMAQ